MNKFVPKIIVYAVYKTPDGIYRGFCSPYDVTCESKSKNAAMQKLKKLVTLYEKGLKKYQYPKHLSLLKLSDKRDELIFQTIQKKIAKEVEKKIREKYLEYQSEKEDKEFTLTNPSSFGFYQQQPAWA